MLRLLLCTMFQNLTGRTGLSDWGAHEYIEEHEKLLLRLDKRTRPTIVGVWIMEEFNNLHHTKLLAVPPPALNNTMRELSDSNLFYHKALKIVDTQFPFPMIQMSRILLFVFLLVTPVVFGHNSGPLYQNVILTATVLISFFCADSIATELSDPFGDDANDLPLMDIMEDFKLTLSDVLPRQDPSAPDIAPSDDDFGIPGSDSGLVGSFDFGMDLDVAGSGSPTSPMGTNIQSGSNLDMDVNPLFDNEKEKLEKSSLLAQQASTWYDMATGDYHSYKANENCVPDDSGSTLAPMLHNDPVQYEEGYNLPQSMQHSEWYDMSTGMTYNYKANETCVLDDSGLDSGPLRERGMSDYSGSSPRDITGHSSQDPAYQRDIGYDTAWQDHS